MPSRKRGLTADEWPPHTFNWDGKDEQGWWLVRCCQQEDPDTQVLGRERSKKKIRQRRVPTSQAGKIKDRCGCWIWSVQEAYKKHNKLMGSPRAVVWASMQVEGLLAALQGWSNHTALASGQVGITRFIPVRDTSSSFLHNDWTKHTSIALLVMGRPAQSISAALPKGFPGEELNAPLC